MAWASAQLWMCVNGSQMLYVSECNVPASGLRGLTSQLDADVPSSIGCQKLTERSSSMSYT